MQFEINFSTFKTAELWEVFRWHEQNVKIIVEFYLILSRTHTNAHKIRTKHGAQRERVRVRATDNHRNRWESSWLSVDLCVYKCGTPIYSIRSPIFISLALCYCFNKQSQKTFFMHILRSQTHTHWLVASFKQARVHRQWKCQRQCDRQRRHSDIKKEIHII